MENQGRVMGRQQKTLALEKPSQLLLRNLNAIVGTDVVVVNPPRDHVLGLLQEKLARTKVVGVTQDYAAYRYLAALPVSGNGPSADILYDALYPADLHCDTAVVYLPKSRELTRMILHMTHTILSPGGRVLLVGANNAGIRSAQPILAAVIGSTQKLDAARHCVLYQATASDIAPSFELEQWVTRYQLAHQSQALTVTTLPGLFSHGRLDAGTRLLLDTIDSQRGQRVLDFGCGCGVIGAMIRATWPTSTVDFVDTNALALLATQYTLTENDIPAGQIIPSDGFSDVNETYGWIISNPPFHQGVQTDYQTTTTFLQECTRYLNPGGVLHVVANRFLNYPPVIERFVGECRIIAETRQYRVYEAVRETSERR